MTRSTVLAVALLAACVDAPDDGPDLATTVQLIKPADGCGNPLVCPGNSDILGALGPYELSTAPGKVSPRGFAIAGITRNGVPVTGFAVNGATLSGVSGGVAIADAAMVGTTLRLWHQSGALVDLQLTQYGTIPYYSGAIMPSTTAYYIQYREVGVPNARWQDLCPYTEVEAGLQHNWAVFWKGDRYDPDTGRIFASGLGSEADGHVGDWFNLSCAGEATIKMLRAEVGEAVAPASTDVQRQATLNMMTAKYCPGPERYTKLGQRLSWVDTWSTNTTGLTSSFEAIWTETGAACLNVPRMRGVRVGCELPRCTKDMLASFADHGELLSANPVVLVPAP